MNYIDNPRDNFISTVQSQKVLVIYILTVLENLMREIVEVCCAWVVQMVSCVRVLPTLRVTH